MPRRRPQKAAGREPRPAPFHAPFRSLAKQIDRAPALPPPASRNGTTDERPPRKGSMASSPTVDAAGDDASSFLSAMADVRPLGSSGRVDAPAPAAGVRRESVDEDAEALAALSDLVASGSGFDWSDSREYVEGAVVGLDARIVKRLRRGEFSYQATLDLHGMTAAAARVAVESFIAAAVRDGHRTVLIVHGRGRNSRDQIPVLKAQVGRWLGSGRIGRSVLAFTSARPGDGGTGAVYVLLRRRRGVREPIDVLEGAKRE
jgi:DNA-nicking Smr family endonuclease